MKRWLACGALILITIAARLQTSAAAPQTGGNPGKAGPCAVSSYTANVGGQLETHFFFPSSDRCRAGIAAPYAAVVFAHGFSMFGLADCATYSLCHGEHLASWGYVVAIPALPDDAEKRLGLMRQLLDYLETETQRPGARLYHQVDVERLAAAGHSLGGATALALAARDPRIKAVVALDPVYHKGGPFLNQPEVWDAPAEAPRITVPTAVEGAPPSACNAGADHERLYPLVGASEKATFLLVGGSHCDFIGSQNLACDVVCGGKSDPGRIRLAQKIMTAWFNYYLYQDAAARTFLYGAEAEADIASGRIERLIGQAARAPAAQTPCQPSTPTPEAIPAVLASPQSSQVSASQDKGNGFVVNKWRSASLAICLFVLLALVYRKKEKEKWNSPN